MRNKDGFEETIHGDVLSKDKGDKSRVNMPGVKSLVSSCSADGSQPGQYADYFWGDDLEGHFALKNHASRSEMVLTNLHQIFKARTKLDEQYSKDINRILKSEFPEEDSVGLDKTIQVYRKEMQNIAKCYYDASKIMGKALAKPFSNFIEYQSMVRKNKAAYAEKELKLMRSCLKKLNITREKLSKRRERLVCLEDSTTKEITDGGDDKKIKSIMKVKNEINSLEDAFLKKSEDFKVFRSKWIAAHTVMCQMFQKLDIDRYKFIINCLQEYSTMQSSLHASALNSYERIKNHLEACDFDKDNEIFLKTHGTGTNPKDYSKYLDLHCADYDSSLDIITKGHVQEDAGFASSNPHKSYEGEPFTSVCSDDQSPFVAPSLDTSQSGVTADKPAYSTPASHISSSKLFTKASDAHNSASLSPQA